MAKRAVPGDSLVMVVFTSPGETSAKFSGKFAGSTATRYSPAGRLKKPKLPLESQVAFWNGRFVAIGIHREVGRTAGIVAPDVAEYGHSVLHSGDGVARAENRLSRG